MPAARQEIHTAVPDLQPVPEPRLAGRFSIAPRDTTEGRAGRATVGCSLTPRAALVYYQIFPGEQRIQSIRRGSYIRKPFLISRFQRCLCQAVVTNRS